MKNAYHKGDHVIFVHCPEYHTVVQSRKYTDTSALLLIQGSEVRSLTFEGQKCNISWYIQNTTLYDAITIKQIYTVFYTRVYNNWCSEFTKKYHDCVYLGLGRLNLTSGDGFWIKRLRGLGCVKDRSCYVGLRIWMVS